MNRTILSKMLSIPTAPFAEHRVIEYIKAFCKRRAGVTLKQDQVGNLLVHVRYRNRKVARPVCITAHLDHPGFIAETMISKTRLRAHWRGGVPQQYFVGSKVRFYEGDRVIKGIVHATKSTTQNGKKRVESATINVKESVSAGAIGMWDFPDVAIRGSKIYARDCDDIAGASAMLCAIDELARKKSACDAYFLFTRAEEVGFIGAIAACRLKTIPKKCFVVAMETSSELPNAQMGDGPILRVGDRTSTFTPAATSHCFRIARELARDDSTFQYQRKLMDGGTCESSAYCSLGYEATGLCIALGNYHNVNVKRGKLGPEYVHLKDFDNVVKWFVSLAQAPYPYTGSDQQLSKQINELEKTYKKLLRASVKKPC